MTIHDTTAAAHAAHAAYVTALDATAAAHDAYITALDADLNQTRDNNAYVIAAAPFLLQTLETIALHAPSLDATGIRELCDEAIAVAKGTAQ